MRRLAVLSILLVVAGLLLLLPSSALYNLITPGSASGSISTRLAAVTSTDNTTTEESLLGFGLIGVGVVLEFLSLFTDVGPSGSVRAEAAPSVSGSTPASPSGASTLQRSQTEEAGTR